MPNDVGLHRTETATLSPALSVSGVVRREANELKPVELSVTTTMSGDGFRAKNVCVAESPLTTFPKSRPDTRERVPRPGIALSSLLKTLSLPELSTAVTRK